MTIDVTDDPTLVREMALAGCTGVFVGFESLNDEQHRRGAQEEHRGRTTTRGASRSCTTTAFR